MSQYLEEAAALLRKSAAANESENCRDPRRLEQGRERIAMKFAQLGAIEHGVMPVELAQLILDQAQTEAGR